MKKNPISIDPSMTNGYISAPYVLEEGEKINDFYLEPVLFHNENGPTIGVTTCGVIVKDGLYFKDMDNDGILSPYEDWRLTPEERAKDLASRLTVEEIAGLMMYSSHQMVPFFTGTPFHATYDGMSFEESGAPAWALTDQQKKFLKEDHLRHVLAMLLKDAETAALWNNEMQAFAESQPHGIPVNISSDPRNGASSAGAEYKSGGGQTSAWPEGLGIAATFDPELCREYARTIAREYRALGIATALSQGHVSVLAVVVEPLVEIVLSLSLGSLMGWLLNWVEQFFHSRSKRMTISVAFVLLTVGLSMLKFEVAGIHCGFSLLLVCMMTGTIFCNICDTSEELMDRVESWTTPLNILFFVISGAELDLAILANPITLIVGIIYILSRSAGKYFGAYASAKISRCEPGVQKYLGITLLPQAGVALGMAAQALTFGGDIGVLAQSITLFAVLIYELFGPLFTRMALTAAGEIKPKSEEVEKRRQIKLDAAKNK